MADALVKSHFIGQPAPAGARPFVLFRRPRAKTGLIGWLTTVDHKKIGMMYGFFATCFLLLGLMAAVVDDDNLDGVAAVLPPKAFQAGAKLLKAVCDSAMD